MRRTPSPSRPVYTLFVAAVATLSIGAGATVAQPVGQQPPRTAPAADPVGAAVAEASLRFGVPESWIRSVMRVESAGNPAAVSRAGAMGLMQVMPGTYAELRSRYGLGPDPFAVRDNIMAGTAYLREMYDRYGAEGMLAAYNAGPGRWEQHRLRGRALPGETIGYLAKLGPMLGIDAPSVSAVSTPATPPSPYRAPLFVALHSMSAADPSSGSPQDLRIVVAANTTVVPVGGELFVRRMAAADEPAGNANSGRAEAASAGAGPGPAATVPAASNPLFPTLSGHRRR